MSTAMSTMGQAILLSLTMTALSTGCLDLSTSGSPRPSAYMGEVSVQLKVGNGTLKALHYSMANDTSSYQGELDVSGTTSVLAVIGGIHVGGGYVLALSGTTAEGAPCQGISGHFGVFSNTTAIVPIDVRCRATSSVGSGLGDPNCPCGN